MSESDAEFLHLLESEAHKLRRAEHILKVMRSITVEDLRELVGEEWSQTYTGKAFSLLDPRPEDVDPIDVAASLSRQCRFNGHVRCSHYSVADHSIRVSTILPRAFRLQGLLHDAAEAYLGDIIRPLKKVLGPVVEVVETGIARAIGERFSVDLVNLPPSIHNADNILLATEKRDIMARPPRPWRPLPEPLPGTIFPLSQAEAERVFLELLGEMGRD